MPLRDRVRYRMKQTPKGPVRLAFREGTSKVVEAKNMKTGATHTPKEFAQDRKGLKRRMTERKR